MMRSWCVVRVHLKKIERHEKLAKNSLYLCKALNLHFEKQKKPRNSTDSSVRFQCNEIAEQPFDFTMQSELNIASTLSIRQPMYNGNGKAKLKHKTKTQHIS